MHVDMNKEKQLEGDIYRWNICIHWLHLVYMSETFAIDINKKEQKNY